MTTTTSRPRTTRPGATASRSSAQARFDQRITLPRRRRRTRMLGVLALITVIASGFAVAFSPYGTVDSVVVTGLAGTEKQMAQAAAGVAVGQPMVSVNLNDIESAIAQRPAIAEVAVRRQWPTTIVVEARPRVPVFAFRLPTGKFRLVDAEARQYATVMSVPKALPSYPSAITSPSPDTARAVAEMRAEFPPSVRPTVRAVNVAKNGAVQFTIGRSTVVWGSTGSASRKAQIIKALLAKKPAIIDVSAPETPVTR